MTIAFGRLMQSFSADPAKSIRRWPALRNRLTLPSTENNPKSAELFARTELRRAERATSAAPALSADWLTGADNPRLRGAF
ncbi:hypothetical protein LJR220_006247 [Bradyrhizobium sp. LjRoot220]|uniref:hypothetical protein n=1 Tax=Bradyrhizobium sp. LjRoot220 TaxID=3342284 RepID=UPI003ECFF3F2